MPIDAADYKGVRVLITGGGGFLGSRLVERLVDAGAEVSIIVHKKAHAWRLGHIAENITLYEVDLRNREATQHAITESHPEIVFNTASSLDTRRTFDILNAVVQDTYDIAKSVVTACVNVGVRKLVHLGTYEEYGTEGAPFLESTREAPISPYSLSKVMATHTVLLAGKLTPLDVSVVRLAATFGPRQGFTMLIPNLIQAGIEGKNFNMNDGEQVRDFIYIDDAVEGILKAGLSEQANSEIINLGSGKGTKVRDIAEMVNNAMGNPIHINFGAHTYRPLDGTLCYMSNNKAKEILHWEPSTIATSAIQETVDWYREHYKDLSKHV